MWCSPVNELLFHRTRCWRWNSSLFSLFFRFFLPCFHWEFGYFHFFIKNSHHNLLQSNVKYKMKLHLHQQLLNHAVLINSTAACMYYAKKRLQKIKKKVPSSRTGCPTQPRTRKSVKAVFNELGRKAFRCV